MASRRHLSPTQTNMWSRCPRQYAFRYEEGIKSPPSGAMKQSGVAHLAYEKNYRQKAETRTDLPVHEMTDFYADTLDKELTREEVVFDKGETAGSLKDQGVKIVKAHRVGISPLVMPASADSVERKVSFTLKESDTFDIMGVIDVIDEQGYIRDNKSLARQPSPLDLAKDGQLSMYALLYRLTERKAETGLKIDAVIKNKEPRAIILPAERTREMLQLHLNKVGHIARAIEHHIFPLNTDGWHCDPRYCGYWDRCVGKSLKTVDMGQNLEQQLK